MADGKIIIETDLDNKGFEVSLSKLGSIATKGSKVAIGAISGVATAVGGVAAASVKVGIDFEGSMSQVAATMGITSEEIANGSESFEMLKKAAKDAGSTTQFSASQSAEALNFLALAGYDAEKSVEALPTVLNLAAAGGLELGYASDLVTDSMSALGLETKDLEGFVDKLAKTSQKSNTSVGQLGEAILTVGGTAKTLAGGTTELNAALGILADNGIKGAEGGTALRNVILSLSAPTDKARSLMKDLGLEVLDAQGNMRPLNDIFGDLNDKLSTMTQGERTEVLSNLFNKVDLKSVNALLSNSGDRFDELTGYIDSADGAAAAMAETMNDNLKGKITQLGSALEGVGIQIYEKLEGPLKTAADTAIESIGKLGEYLTSGSLSKSLESIGESIGKLIEKGADLIADVLPKLIEGFAWLLDNGSTIVSIVGGITGAIVAFKAVGIIQGVVGAWEEAVKQIALFQLGAEGATVAQGVLTGALTIGETIVGLLTGKITLATVAQKLWNLAMSANPIGIVVGLIAGLVAGLVILWNTNEGFRNAVISAWESIKQGAEDCWGSVCNFFTETLPQAWQATVEFFQGIPDWFAGLWAQVTEKFNEWGENVTNFFNETIPMWIENISTWFSELPYKIGEAIGSALANIVNWGTETWNYFSTNVPIWINSVSTWFSELPGKIWTWLYNSIQKIIQWGTDTYNNAKQYVSQTIDSISRYFSELPGKVWKWLSDTIQKMIQWGTDMLNKGKKAASDTAKAIVDGFKNLPKNMLDIGKSAVEGIWNGITSMGSWIGNKISGFCSGIVDGFKKSLKINSPSKIMRDKIGKGIVEGIDVGIENEMPSLDKDIALNMDRMVSKMKTTVDMETSKVSIPVSNSFGTTETKNIDSVLLGKILNAIESIDPSIYMDSRELVDSTVDLFDKSNGQRVQLFERGVKV